MTADRVDAAVAHGELDQRTADAAFELAENLVALPAYLCDAIAGDEMAMALFATGGLDALRGPKFDPLIARYRDEQAARQRVNDAYWQDVRTATEQLTVVLGDRGQGKTTALVEWAKQGVCDAAGHPSRVIVVGSAARAKYLQQQFGVPPAAIHVAGAQRFGVPDAALAVDDLRYVLAVLLGGRTAMVSDTGVCVRLDAAAADGR